MSTRFENISVIINACIAIGEPKIVLARNILSDSEIERLKRLLEKSGYVFSEHDELNNRDIYIAA